MTESPTETNPRNLTVTAISLCGFVAFWWLLSLWRADPQILPAPPAVLQAIWVEAVSGRLWLHTEATLIRVILAFGVSMILGVSLGVGLGLHPRLNLWLDPWVMVFLNLPALVVIALCYLWIGLNEVAAVVAVTVNKTAMVLVTLREGTRTLDPALSDLGRVYRLSALARLRQIILPQLAPYLVASARNGLAIIWKLVLVVEFLGRSTGVGFQIHLKFQLFDITGVLAYALSFVAVMLAVDYGLLQPLERRASGWRGVAGD
jgi:NitT/TauT family transport system permease protein